jgi:hypothetical protein
MSFWSLIKTRIEDLDCFKQSCEKNGVEFIEGATGSKYGGADIMAVFRDKSGHGFGYLVQDGKSYRVAMDTDKYYNSIVARLGANGGKLIRDYTEMVIRKEMRKQGGMVSSASECADGSLLLRVMRAS